MRPGTVHDLPGVYRVCLLTGAAGSDASALHDDPDLLGHVWAGPYLALPARRHPRAARRARGRGLQPRRARQPGLRAVAGARSGSRPCASATRSGSGSTPADRALVERLHHPTPADAGLLVAYPAHLHVDLLPRLQGQGWGRRVVESVLAGLTAAGATGVHLGVDEGNTGAQQFYLRLGFTELEGPPGARYYGMDLGSRSR